MGPHAPGECRWQTRMGFSDPSEMEAGLRAVATSGVPTLGTITLDSFTRTNQHELARKAVREGRRLNGYPLVALGAERTRRLVERVGDDGFPVQVRHGSACPYDIFEVMVAAGITATEGGPVSYCLPYGRIPLRVSFAEWERSVRMLVDAVPGGVHLESFGGCMLGQLCPPDLLIALTVLEAIFFRSLGVRDLSLSYAQQTDGAQDREALRALRALAGEYLGDADWHVVVYTYMGLFPRTAAGAKRLLADSAVLAADEWCERMIVKTAAEAHRIPTVRENVEALQLADRAARATRGRPPPVADEGIHERARTLVTETLEGGASPAEAMLRAFRAGRLDVPYCLHPDNANRCRSGIDARGRLVWLDTGSMPISATGRSKPVLTSASLLDMLSFVRRRFDGLAADADGPAGAHRAPDESNPGPTPRGARDAG